MLLKPAGLVDFLTNVTTYCKILWFHSHVSVFACSFIIMKNIVSVLVHAAAVALASLSVSLAARSSVSSTADSAKGVCGRPKWKIKFHSARWFYNNLKIVSQIAVKSQLCGRNCGNSRNFKLPDSQGASMLTWKLKPLHMREFPVCYCFVVPATGL